MMIHAAMSWFDTVAPNATKSQRKVMFDDIVRVAKHAIADNANTIKEAMASMQDSVSKAQYTDKKGD